MNVHRNTQPLASSDRGRSKRPLKRTVTEYGACPSDEIASPSDSSAPTLNLGGKSGSRCENSLGLLTEKFMALREESEGGTMDLNISAETLGVAKRRIYDITNVLEGIGLIEKKNKNQIQWKASGFLSGDEDACQTSSVTRMLQEEECRLDKQIEQMKERLRELAECPENQDRLYVTEADLKSLPSFSSDTIISIRAPSGTSLEVPDPNEDVGEEGKRYRVILRSSSGPIACYLIDNNQKEAPASATGCDSPHQCTDEKTTADHHQPDMKFPSSADDNLGQTMLDPLQVQGQSSGALDVHGMEQQPLSGSPLWLEPDEEEDPSWFSDASGLVEPVFSDYFPSHDSVDFSQMKYLPELPNMFFSDVY
mmetsp:Transcript_45975/g.76659  ORF Transcript_45975/g.76659 Transcript_45975/m.76659 type:complete len:366 (-) Transcript_45975:360-1457(-)|eukprot:CAMPEP_0198218458 /NCGR_PEP_ID=MMETSP1445-20131203/69399_1 /TAXON_ID=36898 /ORGANISM="Pyramimonas sp., Strain CCMP2087" /LENGTH=365 /DNA_ID=CAMNT_0043895495 /DNA_START=553 /DNA_END=1650 /DNA_ORIENTATION=-